MLFRSNHVATHFFFNSNWFWTLNKISSILLILNRGPDFMRVFIFISQTRGPPGFAENPLNSWRRVFTSNLWYDDSMLPHPLSSWTPNTCFHKYTWPGITHYAGLWRPVQLIGKVPWTQDGHASTAAAPTLVWLLLPGESQSWGKPLQPS